MIWSESVSSAEAPTPSDSWLVAASMAVTALSENVTSMVNGALWPVTLAVYVPAFQPCAAPPAPDSALGDAHPARPKPIADADECRALQERPAGDAASLEQRRAACGTVLRDRFERVAVARIPHVRSLLRPLRGHSVLPTARNRRSGEDAGTRRKGYSPVSKRYFLRVWADEERAVGGVSAARDIPQRGGAAAGREGAALACGRSSQAVGAPLALLGDELAGQIAVRHSNGMAGPGERGRIVAEEASSLRIADSVQSR